MKKFLVLILLIAATLFVGCANADQEDDETYQFLIENIDDSNAIKGYLEGEKSRGNDIDRIIKGGDTVLMIAARYTNEIEVLKAIIPYYPSIHQLNNKTDMSALDYLSRREGTEDMHKYLVDESVKYEVNKKIDSAKNSIIKNLFN